MPKCFPAHFSTAGRSETYTTKFCWGKSSQLIPALIHLEVVAFQQQHPLVYHHIPPSSLFGLIFVHPLSLYISICFVLAYKNIGLTWTWGLAVTVWLIWWQIVNQLGRVAEAYFKLPLQDSKVSHCIYIFAKEVLLLICRSGITKDKFTQQLLVAE